MYTSPSRAWLSFLSAFAEGTLVSRIGVTLGISTCVDLSVEVSKQGRK